MTVSSTSSESSLPELHRQFEEELLRADDPEAVLARFVTLHPEQAEAFRELAEAILMLQATPLRHPDGDENGRPEPPGPRQFGPYRVVQSIGRGGMGEVFEAVEEPLGRRVAVKTIRRSQTTRGPVLLRFDRERRALARLHHTNIVPIYATGREGDLLFFAMPYIDGASLGQVIKTARSHASTASGLTSSTFEDLLREAHSRNRTSSEGPLTTGPAPPSPAAPDAGHGSADAASPAGPSSTAPAEEPGPRRLSRAYIRTVVRAMAGVAEGLHHAHEAGIIHRDLKPSNIMVDTGGHAWVLDFGLAALREAPRSGPMATIPLAPEPPSEGADPLLTDGPLGTWLYMAPEQYQDARNADIRSDVWGLGVTLYELLALQRAFPTGRAVLEDDPLSPRRFNPALDRDLEAIVLKALRKDPAHRYPTAQTLADDLKHWLRSEPVNARPAAIPRRLWLWARRRRGAAVAVGVAAVALVALAVGGVLLALAAIERERAKDRALRLLAIQRLWLGRHINGWSEVIRTRVRDLTSSRQRDTDLQALAAAALAGVDARKIKSFDFAADTLAFDPGGQRLLIRGEDGQVRLWDAQTAQVRTLRAAGQGVFAHRPDGTALQLATAKDKQSLELRDVMTDKVLRKFPAPEAERSSIENLAITPDGKLVGAVLRREDASGVLVIWEAESGRQVRTMSMQRPTVVAFTPDGALFAAGDEDGRITVWPLPEGEPIATLEARRNRINCLLFGPDLLRRRDPPRPGTGWLLAAGDAGGAVTVWDLHTRSQRSVCRGDSYDTYCLAFSPDGTTLATAGRRFVKLWDIASGRLLLNIVSGSFIPALTFSPDGTTLAVAMHPGFGVPGGVDIWTLEKCRGIQTLAGMSGKVEKVILAADNRLVAGLAQDWQVGIWDRAANRLLHLFDAPRGVAADNAALALSPDGRHLAYAAGHEAVLWDVETGRVVRSWQFPAGYQDNLAFHGDQLLSIRVETPDARVLYYDPNHALYPRLVRIRDLLGPDPMSPIQERKEFNRHVFHSAISPDGRYLVVEGKGGPPEKLQRISTLYDAPTGKPIGSIPVKLPVEFESAWFQFDPTSTVLAHQYGVTGPFHLLGIPSLILMGENHQALIGPGGKRWFRYEPGDGGEFPPAFIVSERGRDAPLLRIACQALATPTFCSFPSFSRDGRLVAWGNADGTVSVCDLIEVQGRLAEFGLGW